MSRVKLGDVAIEHKESLKTYKDNLPIVGLEHLIPMQIKLTKYDVNVDTTFTKMFRKGNVLFGRRRAYLKKAVFAEFDGICSGDIIVIEALPDKILPELLPFIIQNDKLFEYAVAQSAGSLSPRVKWEQLKKFEFELPEIEKQKQLADLLWSIEDSKQSYQNLLSLTDELVKSQFIEMLGDSYDTLCLGDFIEYKSKSKIQARDGSIEGEYPLFNSSGEQKLWIDEYLYDGESIFIPTGGKAAINYYAGKCSATTDNIVFTLGDRIKTKYAYLYLWRDLEILQDGFKGSGLKHISKDYVEKIEIKTPIIEIQNAIIKLAEQSDKSKIIKQRCFYTFSEVNNYAKI